MSKPRTGMKPLEAEKPAAVEAEPLNEDVMKGVLVDGLSFVVSERFVLLDGIIIPPRSGKKPVVAIRIIIPANALPEILEGIKALIEHYRKVFKIDLKK